MSLNSWDIIFILLFFPASVGSKSEFQESIEIPVVELIDCTNAVSSSRANIGRLFQDIKSSTINVHRRRQIY